MCALVYVNKCTGEDENGVENGRRGCDGHACIYKEITQRERNSRIEYVYVYGILGGFFFFQLYVCMSHTMSVQSPDPFPFLCLAPFLVHV